jgi:hypothetical protein
VNGTVTHKPGIKLAKKVCNTQSNSIVRLTEHKVKIIGDSHLKGSASRINQHLNTKYKLTSLIKPGANINHLVHSQDKELKCLGKKDVIVINGGTNDMDKYNCKVNGILKMLYSFIVKYSNTNIIIVNLPQRYDQQITSKSNLLIQAFNHKLNNIAKMFNHVSVVEMYLDRRLYTRHGLHMNYQGKEMFAKKVASQIEKFMELSNKSKPIIPLKWKEDISTSSQTSCINSKDNMLPTVNVTVELVNSESLYFTNSSLVSNGTLPRTSTGNKKVPCTRWFKYDRD